MTWSVVAAAAPDLDFRLTATRAGFWLGWISIAAVLAQVASGLEGGDRDLLLGLTVTATVAHLAVSAVPWRRWLAAARGRVLLDLWSAGLLAFVGLLVGLTGSRTSFDLLFFLIVPFIAIVQAGRRRAFWLAAAALTFGLALAWTPYPLSSQALAARASLLVAAVLLALALDRAARREAAQRAEEAARAELERLLLAEAHHRVKNSLQTVADLLLLARPAGAAGAAFDRTAGRVQAIAAVHRLLTEARGGAIAADRLLTAVAAAVDTAITVDGDPVELDAATAQRLGLLANELLTNAVSHGAAPVRVRLRAGPPFTLTVADAGSGAAHAEEGLGLRIVREVAERSLGGSFVLATGDEGTVARVVVAAGPPCAS